METRFDELFKMLGKSKDVAPGSSIMVDTGGDNSRFTGRMARSEDRTNWTSNSSGNYVKILKILCPSFDGTNPRNWIRKLNTSILILWRISKNWIW